MTDKQIRKNGEDIIIENIVQANPTWHKTQPQTLYKLFRKSLTLDTLISWYEKQQAAEALQEDLNGQYSRGEL